MRISAIIFLLVLMITFIHGSPYDESVREIIEQRLTTEFHHSIGLHALVYVDTAEYEKSNKYTQTEVENPYGTLDHCSLFVCGMDFEKESTRFVVGVFKNNNVVWYSEIPVAFEGALCLGNVLGARDLNADGKLELMFQMAERGGEYTDWNLWIFSWDGTTGNMMNDIDQDGMSVIHGSYLLPVDYNGDGLLEIRDASNETNQGFPVVWSWNGSKYGVWPDTPQPGGSFRLRRNAVADIHCSVTKMDSIYQYGYSILNRPESKRRIEDFYISTYGRIISADSLKNIGWTPFLPLPTYPFIHWSSDLNWSTWKQRLLKIGEWWNGFIARSSSLPGIVNYYVQSEQITSDGNYNTMDDILNNSTSGVTISPQRIPDPFIPIGYLDTLTYFTTRSCDLAWIKQQSTADKYLGYFTSAKTALQQNNIQRTRTELTNTLHDIDIDSSSTLTSEAYALLRYNTEYLLKQLPIFPGGLNVKLVNSTGNRLSNGALQYYEGSWKDAVDNNNGTFAVNTNQKTVSLRMTYEYGSQTKSNITIGSDTVVFQTVNTQIKLQDSKGTAIDTGTVQYYAGAWRAFGTTTNGVTSKELLPATYSFRMTYASASNDKQQNIGTNSVVIFKTVNAVVQLQNSQGALIDQGRVQFYAGAWRDFGTTSNGFAIKELLPNNYSFRMSFANSSKDLQQNIGTNPTVIFKTVNATVQLLNSQGTPIDQGTVQYYAGAWRLFGTTSNGITSKELLPNNYSFRMTHRYVSLDKAQNISTNATVSFSTVLCIVRAKNSQSQPVNNALASYYAGAWRQIGTTVNGEITKELLPVNLSFRIKLGTTQLDKTQNLSTNNVVEFSLQP